MINYLTELPYNFYNITQKNILETFQDPTMITLKGKSKKTVIISTILHGNETSGMEILKSFFKQNTPTSLEKNVILFLGNPRAYSLNKRQLENQLDYNRIWKYGHSFEHMIAKEALSYFKKFDLEACIDFHNNTGKNPIYACVNRKKESFLRLAQKFSDKVVYFTEPASALSNIMGDYCPSVTVEGGLSGFELGINQGIRLMEEVINGNSWQKDSITIENVHQSFGTILVHPHCQIDFDGQLTNSNDISIIKDFDDLNFKEVEKDYYLGLIKDPSKIKIINKYGVNITKDFLKFDKQKIFCNQKFTASMFTRNIDVAKSDCLGYLMKKYKTNEFLNY